MSSTELADTAVYFRRGFVPFHEAKISIASSPVLYGLSIYTVLNAIWNPKTKQLKVFRLRDHFQRLINSAKIMDFHSFAEEWDYEAFEDVILELLRRNKVREDALVRVTVFIDELLPGTKIHGLTTSLSAYIYPFGEVLNQSGIHVCVSSWQRTADNAIPARAKVNGSYINASLMKNEALQNGYDDAIAIDNHGHVCEGTVTNLFLIRDNVLITPGTSTDLLEGITRDTILKLADRLGLKTKERVIDRSELYIADEAFMCGSSARIVPILSIDKRPIGNELLGPVTRKVAESYKSLQLGDTADFIDWLVKV